MIFGVHHVRATEPKVYELLSEYPLDAKIFAEIPGGNSLDDFIQSPSYSYDYFQSVVFLRPNVVCGDVGWNHVQSPMMYNSVCKNLQPSAGILRNIPAIAGIVAGSLYTYSLVRLNTKRSQKRNQMMVDEYVATQPDVTVVGAAHAYDMKMVNPLEKLTYVLSENLKPLSDEYLSVADDVIIV